MFVLLVFVVSLSGVSGIQSSVWERDCSDKVLMQKGSEHVTEKARCEVY